MDAGDELDKTMQEVNVVVIGGNLTRDPELKWTQKGTAVAQAALALNRTWRDESGQEREDVSFVDVECWGKTAENLAQYMRKGSPVLVEGRLKQDSWDDRASGQRRSKLKVVAMKVTFLPGADRGGNGGGRPAGRGAEAPQRDGAGEAAQPDGAAEAAQADAADDVPF